jgi:hypothetical protein
MRLETRTARIELLDLGVVVTRIRQGAVQDLADARENLGASTTAAGGVRRPLLVDISGAAPLPPEVRHYYTGERLVGAFTALALVVEASPLGTTMGNIYLRIASPGIPTRLFTREAAALDWLAGQA